jgi:transcription-repair coupling factor (superfamily II helicase)
VRCKSLNPEPSIELVETFLVQYKEALKTKGELQDVAK